MKIRKCILLFFINNFQKFLLKLKSDCITKICYIRKDNIKVFGNDYETPDGTALRDYIHVSDLATAHVKALQLLLKGSNSIYANLGTGKALSVMDVISSVEKISGEKIEKIFVTRRDGDPPILVADPSKARSILNWNCSFSSIDNIVKTALEWHKSNS